MDGGLFWRVAVIRAAAVALISAALAAALSREFFEDWGWLTGLAAWMGCAALTARLLDLPLGRALVGATIAGVPSLLAVLIGVHWLGALLAVFVYAAWCARWARREVAWT